MTLLIVVLQVLSLEFEDDDDLLLLDETVRQFNFTDRIIFKWVSKVILDCIGFALLRSVIGLENSRHPLNQSDAKLKPIATWSLAFSRAWDRLRVFTLSSYWFVVIFIFVMIGRCDYFGFGFSTLNWKLLYTLLTSYPVLESE